MSWVDYDCKMRNSRSMRRKLVNDRDIEVSKYLCISKKNSVKSRSNGLVFQRQLNKSDYKD